MERANESWSEKRIFTTGEAAQVCKVSQQTIIRCFDSGRLTGFRVPGSRFRRIPREELIRFMKANGIPLEQIDGAGKKRILVVDDDAQILELFSDIFANDPRFEVRSAASGYEAGLLTRSFRPHLIILDYMLPDINGNVVCAKVREDPELRETRIVFVSGVVNQEEIDALLAAGGDDFVKKPFNVQTLMETVSRLLSVEAGAKDNGHA